MTYKRHAEAENGWTNWVVPKMKDYKMACCDCGLVHNLDFKIGKIIKRGKKFKNGSENLAIEDVEDLDLTVILRARRNNRATGQIRRKPHKYKNI